MIQIILAFIAGILTIAAPCILLPLPILLGASAAHDNKWRPVFITIGFTGTFALLGLSINFLIQSIGLNPNTLRNLAAILLAFFAGFIIWPTYFEKFTRNFTRLTTKAAGTAGKAKDNIWGGLIIGAIIGVVWAPCAGPILASILTLIAQETELGKAAILLISYAIGAGVPMLLIAYGGQIATTRIRKIAQYSHIIQKVFGIMMLILAISIFFQYDTLLQAKLIQHFPIIGTNLEQKIIDSFRNEEPTPTDESLPTSPQSYSIPLNITPPNNQKAPPRLQSYGKAPEFRDITTWLNSDPLTMHTLKGKVVLIDFWTYSCINCIRTLPYITKWYNTYKDQGLVIIGVHTPEFAFEREISNIQKAIKQHNILYPVAVDNSYGTWTAYNNRYWPAKYLIDSEGTIVYTHFGEGEYETTERVIQSLLKTHKPITTNSTEQPRKVGSPEMYFGTARIENLSTTQTPSPSPTYYTLDSKIDLNRFTIGGTWQFYNDRAVTTNKNSTIRLHFASSKVFMVAMSKTTQQIKVVSKNTGISKEITVSDATLYTLFDQGDGSPDEIEIQIPESDFEIFTFTFG